MSDISSADLSNAIKREFVELLRASVARVQHCLDQLSPEQVWWRPAPDQNSVGNLVLHVCGNLQQWVVDGIPDQTNERNRSAEFDESRCDSSAELIDGINRVVADAEKVIQEISPDLLLESRTIQGFNVTVLGVLSHSIPHFAGHTHQVVTLTRIQLGKSYRFHWQPSEPPGSVPL